MKYTCALLSVDDINAARRFYEDLFELKIGQDNGKTIVFTCGLALQQNFDRIVGLPKNAVKSKANNVKIVFEEERFDDFLKQLAGFPHIAYLGDAVEQSWGQRFVRFYNPDGHMIEVGEAMKTMIERFLASGMTLEAAAVRMEASVGVLKRCCSVDSPPVRQLRKKGILPDGQDPLPFIRPVPQRKAFFFSRRA